MASVRLKPQSKFYWACVTITLPDGSRKQRQFSTGLTDRDAAMQVAVTAESASKRLKPDQLRAALNRLADDLCEQKTIDPAQWLLGWAERARSEIGPDSYLRYLGIAKEAGRWFTSQGLTSLSALTRDNIRDLRDYWLKRNLETTANGKLRVLRVALRAAWTDGLIPDLVGNKVKAGKGETNTTKRRNYREGELELIMKVVTPRWKVICLFGIYTAGQRFGDVATMRANQVDLIQEVVSLVTRKTGLIVHLPIVSALRDALCEMEMPEDPNAYLFPDLASMNSSNRSLAFKNNVLIPAGLAEPHPAAQAKKRKGEEKSTRRRTSELGYHSFRHTATTMLKAANVSDSIARAIVGHKSEAVSRQYTHLDLATMRAAMEKMPIVR